MKKFLLLLTLLCTLFSTVQAVEVTIGEDLASTSGNTSLPLNSYFNYSISQQIYTADEIGMAGTINSITLWMYGASSLADRHVDIYMAHVDKDAFADYYDWVNVTDDDKVVEEHLLTLTNTSFEAFEIALDNPFVYDGTSNLLIVIRETTGSYTGSSSARVNGKVFTSEDNVYRALYYSSDSSNPNPSSITVSGSRSYARNVILLNMDADGGPVCSKPASVAASDVSSHEASLAWAAAEGEEGAYFNVGYKAATATDTIMLLTNTQLTLAALSDLAPATKYQVFVQTVCGEETSKWINTSFTTECDAYSIIANGEWSEGFESYTGTSYSQYNDALEAVCWTMGGTASVKPHVGVESGSYSYIYPHEGTKALTFYGNGYCYAALPLFAESLNALRISFWAQMESTSYGKLSLGYITDADPGDFSTFNEIASYDNVKDQIVRYEMELDELPADAHRLAFCWYCGNQYSCSIDDILVRLLPTCKKPGHLAVVAESTTQNSVQLEWTAKSEETAWKLQYKKSADEAWIDTLVYANPILLENLENHTSYDARVAAVCDAEAADGISDFSDVLTFATAAGTPFVENFTEAMPSDWARYTGLAEDIVGGYANLEPYVPTYSYSDYGWKVGSANGAFTQTDNHLYLRIYGTDCKQWVVSPYIVLGEDVRLTFDLALTKYSGSLAQAETDEQGDDKFIVLITKDFETWEPLYTRANDGEYDEKFDDIECSAIGRTIAIDLSDYYGQTVAFAFYGESTVAGGDNNIHIDNFKIAEIPNCEKPAGVKVAKSATAATFTWDEAEEGNPTWAFCLKENPAADFAPADEDFGEPIAELEVLIDTLKEKTDYIFYLRTVCDEASSEYISLPFTTPAAPITAPWAEDFENMAASTVPEDWDNSGSATTSVTSNPSYVWGVYSYGGNKMIRMYNYYVSAGTALINTPNITIPTDDVYELVFDYSHLANCGDFVVKVSTDFGESWSDALFTVPQPASAGSYTDPGTFTEAVISLSDYAGETIMIQFFSTANYSNGAIFVDNVRVRKVPTCFVPTAFAADEASITTTSVQIDWTPAEEGSEENWLVQYKKGNEAEWHYAAADVQAHPFVLEGLEASSIYSIRVAAWCDPSDSTAISEFSAPISVATACETITEFPYTENFDASESLPACWNTINTTTNSTYAGYPGITADEYAPSQPNALLFRSYNDYYGSYDPQDQYAILPEMEGISGMRIKLYAAAYTYYSTTYDATFTVGVMTDPADASTFVPVATKCPTTDDYELYTIPFHKYTGEGKYIAIKMAAATSSYRIVFIDDIRVEVLPNCLEPEGLVVEEVGADTAKLAWENVEGAAWKYAVALANAQPAEFVSVDTNVVVVNELADNSDYIFYLLRDCGNEVSDTVSIAFHTNQAPVAVPFADDFEGDNNWLFINSAKHGWVIGEAAHNGAGTHAMYVSTDNGVTNSYNNSGANIVYATKSFNFPQGSYVFQYDWLGKGEGASNDWDYLRVALIPAQAELVAGTIPSGFNQNALPAGCIALDGGHLLNLEDEWQTVTTEEIAVPAGTYMVVFAWKNDGSGGSDPAAAIDNFSITKVACGQPTNLQIADITSNSATLSWTADAEQDAWQIAYSADPAFVLADATPIDIASNPYALAELLPDTTYVIYVRAHCDEDQYSAWSAPKSFKTAEACQTPDDLAAVATLHSATISWNTYGQEGFNLRYRVAGTEEWIDSLDAVTPFVINELVSSTQYEVQVQVACKEEDDEWSSSLTFKTAFGVPYEEHFDGTSIPDDWSRMSGLIGDNLTSTTSGWYFGTSNGVFDSHARLNIYGTSCKYWMATPVIYVEDNVQLTFDVALTVYTSGSSASPTPGQQADDKFVVLVSNDNGANWSILRQWDNAGSEYVYDEITNAADGQPVAINLSAYAGQGIQIAFYGESTVSGGDNNLHVDNVVIDYIPACAKPTGLTISEIEKRSVKLAWESDAESWQIRINGDNNNLIDVTENPYVLSNLAPDSMYYVEVRGICGEDYSDYTAPKSFTTLVACPAPKALKAILTPGDGSIATLKWSAGAEEGAWVVSYGTDESFENAIDTAVVDSMIDLTGLTAEAIYYARVKAVCGEEDGESAWSAEISFVPTNALELIVNDGESTNTYVPVYGLYVDTGSKSQFIIPAEDLADIEGDTITKLTFYAQESAPAWGNPEFEVYMAEVEETSISAMNDWSALTLALNTTGLSVVNGQMEVALSVPYKYEGGNLLIGFNQTGISSTYKTVTWYGVEATGASLGGYNTSISQRNFLPKMKINYAKSSDVPGPGEGIFQTGADGKAVKFIRNNHVYILINGTVYNVTGQKVEVK